MKRKPIVIDLFSGCGGFSLGAAQAGFKPGLGIDIDPDIISAYRRNFPRAKAVQANIKELDGSAWKHLLGDLRVSGVIGGPPCQGFSRMGNQRPLDPRNQLVTTFFECVRMISPGFFVMENVEGLLDEKFQALLESAISNVPSRYTVLKAFKIDASRLGVPTERHRVMIVGYDRAKVSPLEEADFVPDATKRRVTVRQAIGDLPPPSDCQSEDDYGWRTMSPGRLSSYARRMRQPLPEGVGWKRAIESWKLGSISGFHATLHTKEVVDRFKEVSQGESDSVSRYPRLRWDGLCPTLRAGTGVERGSFQAARPIHPEEPRVITVREAARLQGFSDAFAFHSTKWHSFRMIGNSVSPPVSEFALDVIRKKLES